MSGHAGSALFWLCENLETSIAPLYNVQRSHCMLKSRASPIENEEKTCVDIAIDAPIALVSLFC